MKEQLKKLVFEKASKKIKVMNDLYLDRINAELKEIEESNSERHLLLFEKMFEISNELNIELELWDSRKTYSLVCYCLGINPIDPVEFDLPYSTTSEDDSHFFRLPIMELDRLMLSLKKSVGKKIYKCVEIRTGDIKDSEKNEIIEYKGNKYFTGGNTFHFTDAHTLETFTLDGIDYMIYGVSTTDQEREDLWNSKSETQTFYWFYFKDNKDLSMLQNLRNKSGVAVSANKDYNDPVVYDFISKNKLENVFKDSFSKNWLSKFPMNNLNDFCIALAYNDLENGDFTCDYFELAEQWKPEIFNSDARIFKLFDRANGTLVFTESIQQLLSLILGITLKEALDYIYEAENNYQENPEMDYKEIFDTLELNGLKNTTASKSELRQVAYFINGAIPFCHSQVTLLERAMFAYQLAFYKFYHLDVFNSVYEKFSEKVSA